MHIHTCSNFRQGCQSKFILRTISFFSVVQTAAGPQQMTRQMSQSTWVNIAKYGRPHEASSHAELVLLLLWPLGECMMLEAQNVSTQQPSAVTCQRYICEISHFRWSVCSLLASQAESYRCQCCRSNFVLECNSLNINASPFSSLVVLSSYFCALPTTTTTIFSLFGKIWVLLMTMLMSMRSNS